MSLADFVVIAAEAVTGRLATSYNKDDYFAEGTLAREYRKNFKAGRVTDKECTQRIGLMPDPEDGCVALVDVFHDHVFADTGIPWTMTAAMMGAHTIGSAKPENSGFEGFWSDEKNAGIFNNNYYASLVGKGWAPNLAVHGNPKKNQW